MALHPDEVPVDEGLVRALLRAQRPDLADATITAVGGGTDNTMFRLDSGLVARFPRTPEKVAPLHKELTWLPRLRPRVTHRIPAPVHHGRPTQGHPLPWAVLTWVDGRAPSAQTVTDWARYGADLAWFVASLHSADLGGATRGGELCWYRGGPLHPLEEQVASGAVRARPLVADLDWDLLLQLWREAVSLPAPEGPQGWLHGDLRPANVLVQEGRLHGVLDFGSLSVGHPDAEHVVAWDMPASGRDAYRAGLDVDELTWCRARGWAIALSIGGICEYWRRLPSLAAECVHRLRTITADDGR